jgi:hypothetical protein
MLLLLLALPLWAQDSPWKGPVGPAADALLTLRDGRFVLTFNERWDEPRSSTASGEYTFDGELLELEVESVSFDGNGKDTRDPAQGFTISTPRKGAMDQPDPRLQFRPGAYIRLDAVVDDNLLELRGNGGFELSLWR